MDYEFTIIVRDVEVHEEADALGDALLATAAERFGSEYVSVDWREARFSDELPY